MKVTTLFLLEGNTQDLAVQLAACRGFADDRAKAGDEQDSDICDSFHGVSFAQGTLSLLHDRT
ncbi:MAG: hypothetical protein WAM82_18570 [Thermoanaerobaculia bacterium]